MRIYKQAPCPALSAIVRRFLVIEFPTSYHDVHLPDSGAVAAFSFRGVCRINGDQWAPPTAFAGPREILRAREHRDSHAGLLVTFTPVGAHTFLRSPLDEIADSTAPENEHRGSGDTTSEGWPITALLFLEARDLAEATEVAEAHPALRYGSEVEVRPWAPPSPVATATPSAR